MAAVTTTHAETRPTEHHPDGRPAHALDDTDRLLNALGILDTVEWRRSLILMRAIRLAPTLEVCEALLRGERAPISRLDPEWTRRYGLR